MTNPTPVKFEVWIGGHLGPSYKVFLEERTLVYEVYETGYELHAREVLTPTPGEWRCFLQMVDTLGFWDWRESYSAEQQDPSGTNWSVHLEYQGRSVTAQGDGAYAPAFVDFLRAVRGLLAGRQFA